MWVCGHHQSAYLVSSSVLPWRMEPVRVVSLILMQYSVASLSLYVPTTRQCVDILYNTWWCKRVYSTNCMQAIYYSETAETNQCSVETNFWHDCFPVQRTHQICRISQLVLLRWYFAAVLLRTLVVLLHICRCRLDSSKQHRGRSKFKYTCN